jgi:hypothetical protein
VQIIIRRAWIYQPTTNDKRQTTFPALDRQGIRHGSAGFKAPAGPGRSANAPCGTAATAQEAEQVIDGFRDDACRSDEHFEAAFLAAPVLRDLARIDPDEAAYLFDHLFHDPHGRKPRYAPSTVATYRAHGESELATMMEKRMSTYVRYCMDGDLSLISGKPPAGDPRPSTRHRASLRSPSVPSPSRRPCRSPPDLPRTTP